MSRSIFCIKIIVGIDNEIKGKDVMNFVGDHTMCMMDTRTNVTSFVRATEEAESRHEEGHPALYYTTDEYKETQVATA